MSDPLLTDVVHGYLACAAWTATGPDGDDEQLPFIPTSGPADDACTWDNIREYVDLATVVEAVTDCQDFLATVVEDDELYEQVSQDGGQTGHDFFLTRAGHGVGFWDRGLGELGDRLTDIAKQWGEPNIEFECEGSYYLA